MSRDMRFSNNVVYATSKGSDQPAHTRSLIRAFASRLNSNISVCLSIINATFTLCPRRPRQSRFRPPWTKRGDRNTT